MRFRFDPLITKQALKGVVRLKKNLREQTRKAVEKRRQKMGKRLSKAEKKNAKTMATVAAVYTTSSIIGYSISRNSYQLTRRALIY